MIDTIYAMSGSSVRPPTSGTSTNRRPIAVLLGSTGASVTGNAMVEVLVPWLVLRETGSAAYAGAVGAAALVAVIVSLVFGAAFVDRVDRRDLSSGADLLSAVAVAAIPIIAWLGGLSAAVLIALVMVGALFDGPGRAAREALRPDIGARSSVSLERTNALGEVIDGIGGVLGPVGAGLAVAALGLMWSFWVAAGLLLIAGLIFLFGLGPFPPVTSHRQTTSDESYLDASVAGFRRVWRDPVLRAISISASLFGLLLAPVVLVFTAAFEATDRPTALGGLLAAFSAGSIGGALAYAAIGRRVPRRVTLLGGFLAVSIGLVSMSLAMANYAILIVIACATGFAAGPIGPTFSVIIQQRTADAYRGRVLATIGTLELLVAPMSLAVIGVIIEATSATISLGLIGAGCLGGTVYTITTPHLREIESADLTGCQDT